MSFYHYLLLLIISLLSVYRSQSFQCWRGGTPMSNCSLVDEKGVGEGKSAGHPMIINGEPVQLGEALYQLALLRSGTFICGASLIAPRTAITAGHCVYGFDLTRGNFAVRYGSLNLTDTDSKSVSVFRVILHPAFTSATFNSDVAILILAERIILDDNVGLIEISEDKVLPIESSLVTVLGWGLTSSQVTSDWLMRAELTVIQLEKCQTAWATDGQPVIREVMFCASGRQQSSCKGDSGGPVVLNSDGVEKLVGLVSWGSRYCMDERFPNVYAKVTGREIRDWIELNTIQ